MKPLEQWSFLEALQPVGNNCQIAEWGMLVLKNEMLRGAQKIQCRPHGIFQTRGGSESFAQDCILIIPPDTPEADADDFDFARPQDRWEVVYGRVYCIFEIRVRYFEQSKRSKRPLFQDEICVLVKQFTRVAATHMQRGQKVGSRGQAAARKLGLAGCIKLREERLARSIWSVVPASYVLGRAAMAPVAIQSTSKVTWDAKTDDKERLHWALPWPLDMGKDRGGRILQTTPRATGAGGAGR